MNKMLVVVFDTEKAADAGTHALRKLHEDDITLHAMAVIARDIANASRSARSKLQAQVVAANAGLGRAVQHARQRVEELKHEADDKATALEEHLSHAEGEARVTLEGRVRRTKSASHVRGAKLPRAWGLTKEALAV
jgi:hypothetical protein